MYKSLFVKTLNAQVLLTFFLGLGFLILFQSCEKDKVSNEEKVVDEEKITDASLSISKITALSPTSFRIVGKIEKGSADILEYGFYYSAGGEVKIDQSTKIQFSGKTQDGNFDEEIKGLNLDETYGNPAKIYVKAYVTDQKKTSFSKIISVNMPEIKAASLNKNEGKSGDLIKVSGSFFVSDPANITVMFGGVTAKITALSDTALTAEIPSGIVAHHGELIPVELKINEVTKLLTNDFKIVAHFKDFNPKSGVYGEMIQLEGDNMPIDNYPINFYFNDLFVTLSGTYVGTPYLNAITDKIKISTSIDKGPMQLLTSEFTVIKPVINAISPLSVIPGSKITVTGKNFPKGVLSFSQYSGKQSTINGVDVDLYMEHNKPDEAFFFIPLDLEDGEYPFVFNVGPHQVISSQKIQVKSFSYSLSQQKAFQGSEVFINGEFLTGQFYEFYLNNKVVGHAANSDGKQLRLKIPYGITSPAEGILYLGLGATRIPVGEFKILLPSITSISSVSGKPGSNLNITGTDLLSSKGQIYFVKGTTTGSPARQHLAVPTAVTETSMTIIVPAGLEVGEAYEVVLVANSDATKAQDKFTVN